MIKIKIKMIPIIWINLCDWKKKIFDIIRRNGARIFHARPPPKTVTRDRSTTTVGTTTNTAFHKHAMITKIKYDRPATAGDNCQERNAREIRTAKAWRSRNEWPPARPISETNRPFTIPIRCGLALRISGWVFSGIFRMIYRRNLTFAAWI